MIGGSKGRRFKLDRTNRRNPPAIRVSRFNAIVRQVSFTQLMSVDPLSVRGTAGSGW